MTMRDLIQSTLQLPSGAVFHRCALQGNPHLYGSTYQGNLPSGDAAAHTKAIIQKAGRLPNTVTADTMPAGYRASRSELIKEVLRDYHYIEGTGLGVPRKIIDGMRANNGAEPDLVDENDRFPVRSWNEPRGGPCA